MIPLITFYRETPCNEVFAFARFTNTRISIIAINFSNKKLDFYFDLSPLKQICQSSLFESHEKWVFKLENLINPTEMAAYYSGNKKKLTF